MSKFKKLGQLVMTRAVNDRVADDEAFAKVVTDSLKRYINCDWGDTCEEDKKRNDEAVKTGERILAAYTIDPSKGKSKGFGENTIWIITEWDRSVTTILYPDEY